MNNNANQELPAPVSEKANGVGKALSTYSLFSAIWLMNSRAMEAAIIYSDIDPDKHFGSEFPISEFFLNFNGDISVDIRIVADDVSGSIGGYSSGYWMTNSVGVRFIYDNQVLFCTTNYGGSLPCALEAGVLINPDDNWNHGTTVPLAIYNTSNGIKVNYSGDWLNGVEDKYMAVQFNIGGAMHYGWGKAYS